jgi:hypothetical protein
MKFSVSVKVTAKARERSVSPGPGGLLHVRTTEVPEHGRANEDVIALLAEHFGVSKSAITLKSGRTASRKIFFISA